MYNIKNIVHNNVVFHHLYSIPNKSVTAKEIQQIIQVTGLGNSPFLLQSMKGVIICLNKSRLHFMSLETKLALLKEESY